jgi:hypothetical protein
MTQKTRFPPKIDAPVGTCCRRNVITCGAAARKGDARKVKRRSVKISLSCQLRAGRQPSSKAQVARHATASKISFPPPSTTTVRPEPTAECRLVLRLPGGCRLGARTGTATIWEPPRPTACRPPPSSSTWPPSACSSGLWCAGAPKRLSSQRMCATTRSGERE